MRGKDCVFVFGLLIVVDEGGGGLIFTMETCLFRKVDSGVVGFVLLLD